MRIGERAQQNRQRLDLGRPAKGTRSTHLDGDIQRLQCTSVGGNPVSLLPGQNQEVTEPATAGIDFRPNIARNLLRVLFLKRCPLASCG